ncbi:TOPRIM nucleotidyl transferase/hydrolase domain-containing protein [Lactobacillus crispatus]
MRRIRFEFNSNVTNNVFSVDEMSDGIKSLFYISNIASVLAIENTVQEDDIKIEYPVVTIFALEEPENHISPHLLGKVMDKVKSITKLDNTQTIITSHSPAIIKRVLPENVRYFHLTKDAVTEVKKIKLPDDKGEKYKFIKRAVQTYPELYFSKLVILGEGESEEIVLSKIISSYTGLDEANISIVPLAGRMVNYLWDLLESLNIAHITLLDLDYGRYLGGKKRIKDIIDELKRFNPNDDELEKIENKCADLAENKNNLLDLTKQLEKYDVFFSFPLDLDFMMLAAFLDKYKGIASGSPKTKADERKKILDRTLKGKREEEVDYDKNDIELMRWYNMLFLGIGKPLVHFTALEDISEEELCNNLPEQLKRLLESVKNKLDKKNDE